ncbi:hypothetical protein D3C81_2192070 [compost metagenome]
MFDQRHMLVGCRVVHRVDLESVHQALAFFRVEHGADAGDQFDVEFMAGAVAAQFLLDCIQRIF